MAIPGILCIPGIPFYFGPGVQFSHAAQVSHRDFYAGIFFATFFQNQKSFYDLR